MDKILRFSSQKSIKTNTTVYETHKPLLTGKSGLVATMQDAEFPGAVSHMSDVGWDLPDKIVPPFTFLNVGAGFVARFGFHKNIR